MKKIFNSLKKLFVNILIILKNYNYLKLFISEVIINKKKIFPINGAIGHFSLSLYFSKQLYNKDQCIFFYTSESYDHKYSARNHNDYLFKKTKKIFNFNQDYKNVYEIVKAVNSLIPRKYNFDVTPEHMAMGEFNFSKLYNEKSKLFEFTEEENLIGDSFLKQHNLTKNKFICFIVRTSEYNINLSAGMGLREKKTREFYNVNPKNYIPALKYLTDLDYKIIRMGKGFSQPFPFLHENFIDYAISNDRNDFLDVWLSANCYFFFGTNNGPIALPSVFNKPFLGTNAFPLGVIHSYIPKSIHLPRIAQRNGKLLNIREQVELDVIKQVNGVYYEKEGIQVLENTSDEILNAVKDIENKIANGFFVNDLNMKFWNNMEKEWKPKFFSQNIKRIKTSFQEFHKINGINSTIPDFYLNKYSDLFLYY